ncbi:MULTISPECIES: GTP-binding protein [Hyphomicrobium]|uniref:Bifunctional enzyme NodQ n=1 Tax=Hyphomicrobium sulfonivorans TaxID=121290 RepID=A0A120CWK0_HYPSL|nr:MULTISPECIES: GTP-binding protein [Hyphomicrobium]KWT69508.1 Sulfate adenylyltransferase subunit 1 [Hyphomicrobium sulfonivorans]MDH4981118.1 GTP-binding protein [Hyphomicrobium sp. D-2]
MTAVTAIRREATAPALKQELDGILHLLTCGSVDDGKSTLIGRLLYDASDLSDDQRALIDKSTTASGQPDYSLLLDGLVAEREQGITIDIAWRYFDTDKRRFVVIDSPGHEQYTRNMASGASHADVAIMLVDARHGVKRQTRRHAAILDIVGVRRVILAVNKMDLVDWSQEKFRAIEADFRKLTLRFGFRDAIAVPVSAVTGDNIAHQSEHMPWYSGPHLLEYLEKTQARDVAPRGPFRLPVQTVLRDGVDFRGLAGTVASGYVSVGDRVTDVLSGQSAHVLRIATMDHDLEIARQGQAVAIQLDTDIDVARGAVISAADSALPIVAGQIEARIIWLWETPFDNANGYLLRTGTDLAPIADITVSSLLDLESLAVQPATTVEVNDIANASITLGRPVAVDTFADNQPTGVFLIVDALTGASVAGGVITAATAGEASNEGAFHLTRELLTRGLCRDLGESDEDRREFQRRANEAALLLQSAGVQVKIDI